MSEPEVWHNHLTRDIKPPGECEGCDRHHAAKSEAEALLDAYPAPAALVAEVDEAIARKREEIALRERVAQASEDYLPPAVLCEVCKGWCAPGVANLGTEWVWWCSRCEISVKIAPRSERP